MGFPPHCTPRARRAGVTPPRRRGRYASSACLGPTRAGRTLLSGKPTCARYNLVGSWAGALGDIGLPSWVGLQPDKDAAGWRYRRVRPTVRRGQILRKSPQQGFANPPPVRPVIQRQSTSGLGTYPARPEADVLTRSAWTRQEDRSRIERPPTSQSPRPRPRSTSPASAQKIARSAADAASNSESQIANQARTSSTARSLTRTSMARPTARTHAPRRPRMPRHRTDPRVRGTARRLAEGARILVWIDPVRKIADHPLQGTSIACPRRRRKIDRDRLTF